MRNLLRVTNVWGLVAGTLLAAVVSAAPAMAEEREEFHKSYPLAANGHVSLQNVNGGVKITAWDKNEVQVDAVKSADTKQLLDEAKIEVNADASSIEIKTRYPENDNHRHHHNSAKVEYELHVPRAARLDKIDLVNGGLKIEGVRGGVTGNVVNGEAWASNVAGRISLSTVNGRVVAEVSEVGKDTLELNTVNGSVEVRMPSNVNSELSASTVNGGITNDFDIPVQKGFVGRTLKARLGEGGMQVKLSAVNGGVKISRTSDGKPLSKVTNLLSEANGHYF